MWARALFLVVTLTVSAPALADGPRAVARAETPEAKLDAIDALSPGAAQKHAAYLERALRAIPIHAHEAARDGDAEASAIAERGYRMYLGRFPDHANATEIQYALGELLYAAEKFDEAYAMYRAVVRVDPSGPRARFCAHSAIYAAQEMVKREHPDAPDAPQTAAPVALGTWELRYREALEDFIRAYPDDKDVVGATYKLGYMLYQRGHFPDAEAQFRDVIAQAPQSQDAMTAAKLILDMRAVERDWRGLRGAIVAFMAQEDLGDDAFKSTMAVMLAKTDEFLAAPLP